MLWSNLFLDLTIHCIDEKYFACLYGYIDNWKEKAYSKAVMKKSYLVLVILSSSS